MERYSRGKIYKIVCNTTGKQFIGSTCESTLSRRLARHIKDYKRFNDEESNSRFVLPFLIFNENNYHIELIELFSCSSKDELLARERFHIQNNECINKYIILKITNS
jgi:hypothetical protein